MSWLKKLSTLQKLASRQLFYHGTSHVNLQSILSEGLNNNHDTLYSPDFAPDKMHSIESYGGIYFTSNLMTALSSAGQGNKKYTGNYSDDDVVVMAELETSSPHIVIDEDRLPNPTYAVQNAFKGISPNGFWWLSWAANNFDKIDEISKNFLANIAYTFKVPETETRFIDNLIQYVPEMIKAYANREIAIFMQQDSWGSYKYQYPEFANYTLPETEAVYRRLSDQFIQKAHRLADFLSRTDDKFWVNVRSMQPITFRGSNRIVAVFRTHDNKQYFETTGKPRGFSSEITVVYLNNSAGQALNMFIKDYTQRVGQYFIVKDQKGTVYYQNFDKEIKQS